MRYFYSVYADSARIALQSILAHKLRAFLTLIGIIIGVAAVVVVGASVSGLNTYVTERVAKVLGANHFMIARIALDRKSTRLNSSHSQISYAVFCLKKKKSALCYRRAPLKSPLSTPPPTYFTRGPFRCPASEPLLYSSSSATQPEYIHGRCFSSPRT